MIEVREYITAQNVSPFRKWVRSLNIAAAAKVTRAIERIVDGNLSNVKSVGEGVLEFRIHAGPGYRVYFGRDGDRLVILLAGGTKQRQQNDIAAAKAFWKDYKQRKPAEEKKKWH